MHNEIIQDSVLEFPGSAIDFQHHELFGFEHLYKKYRLYHAVNVIVRLAPQSDFYPDSPLGQEIFTIETDELYRNFGYGGKALHDIIKWSDYHHYALYLNPGPFGDGEKLNEKQLVSFYKKFGFTKTYNSTYLERVSVISPLIRPANYSGSGSLFKI